MEGNRPENKTRVRPHCFTIRELLILVATFEEKEQRVAYLEKVFGWFFERTRSAAFALGAGGIALGVAFSSWIERGLTVIAIFVVIGLIAAALFSNHVLAPLHREYLERLALLEDIGAFEEVLRCRFVSKGWPESRAILRWGRRTLWASKAVEKELDEAVRTWKVNSKECRDEAIARHLVDILAYVPTDQVERHANVRKHVNGCLDRASRAKAGVDDGSWQKVLMEKHMDKPEPSPTPS